MLPQKTGQKIGRFAIKTGFKFYLSILSTFCATKIDLIELHSIAKQKQQIIIANHPSLLDAVLLLSVFDNAACVMKDKLMNNFLLGSAARLAGFIPNSHPLQTILKARTELQEQANLIVFPEGSRTITIESFRCHPSIALIAQNAQTDIQVCVLVFSPDYLGKRWPWYQPPSLPMTIKASHIATISYQQDSKQITTEIEQKIKHALITSA